MPPGFSIAKEVPTGWQRCDGTPIERGPLAGRATPDLNNSRRFLRGGSDQEAEQLQDGDLENHQHLDSGLKINLLLIMTKIYRKERKKYP